MPRELSGVPAPAMAPAPPASVAGVVYKSLIRMVRMPDLEAKVIAAWVVWFILRQLQSILGPMRRRSRHGGVQYGARAAYYLPTIIAFYAANAVRSSSSDFKIPLSFGCAVLLFACARGAVTMTAFTLGRGTVRVQSLRLLPWLLYLAWLEWDSVWLNRRPTKSNIISFFVVFVGPVVYVVVCKPRAAVLDYETKQFADYMVRESRSPSSSSLPSSPFFNGCGDDANSLYEVCKYPFLQLKDGGWINFSDVLNQRERLPADCADGDPADICLSYSFCRLLARLYFGFPCAEVGDPQVREFVLTDLVAADYKRAFTIVEVQLALLHDYFFTNFHSDLASGFVSLKQWIAQMSLLAVVVVASGAVSSLIRGDYKQGHSGLVYLCAYSVPAALMYIVIIHPQSPRLPSYWHPIQNLYLYYQSAAAPRSRSSSQVCRQYWREKLSQYSVMEDYDQRSSKKTILAWCKVHFLSQVSYSFIKHHPAEGDEVRVPDSVRRLVAHAIKDLSGPPTIGSKSLLPVVDDLSWTYRQETLSHTILIWHIATCYCDMLSPETTENHEVATILSRYCAYLVAFLPELLPEHNLTAKFVLQQVLQEPRDLLGGTLMSMEAKRTRIQELQLPEDESDHLTSFQKGVRLGRQLEQQADVSLCWKAMADFWVEMILYLSSSPDNAAAHVEQLAQGGEFVTHLWALLCNAGLVKHAT